MQTAFKETDRVNTIVPVIVLNTTTCSYPRSFLVVPGEIGSLDTTELVEFLRWIPPGYSYAGRLICSQ